MGLGVPVEPAAHLPGMAQVWDECERHKALWVERKAAADADVQTDPEGREILPCGA